MSRESSRSMKIGLKLEWGIDEAARRAGADHRRNTSDVRVSVRVKHKRVARKSRNPFIFTSGREDSNLRPLGPKLRARYTLAKPLTSAQPVSGFLIT
jgi:hypothetical protein